MDDTTTAPSHARRTVLIAAAAVVALILGLVGGYVVGHRSSASTGLADVAARASASGHNSADIAFARAMIPHHRQAVTMAALADSRAGTPQVAGLAAAIEAAQQPEIDAMRSWLRAWGSPGAGSSATAHGMSGDMGPGMMSGSDLRGLRQSHGRAFDTAFLTMMVGHHEGAVEMARAELAHGTNADALALAASIELTQQAQIAQMKNFLTP